MARSAELTEAISAMIGQQPFFAVLLFDLLKIEESETVPTAGTDGRNLYINPKFFKSLTVKNRVFVLSHEVLHVVHRHPDRGRGYQDRGFGPDLQPWSHRKYNRAADYVINRQLCDAKVGEMPLNCLYHPDITGDDLVDEVYCKIPDEPEDDPNHPGNQNGNGQGWDTHLPGGGSNPGPDKATIQRALKGAAAHAKAMGKLPAGMERLVGEVCEPQTTWQERLRAKVQAIAGGDESTWKRPNRRRIVLPPHPYLPGRTSVKSGPIAVEIDTSGSVSPHELSVFFGELSGILSDAKPEKVYAMYVDAALFNDEVIELESPEELEELKAKAGGGGGTDMTVVFKEIEERQLDVDYVIVFTDGYTPFGEDVGIPTIWCITTKGVTAPWGETVHVTIPAAA